MLLIREKSRLVSERTTFCECLGVFGWMTKSEDRGFGLAAETQREILEENLAWQGTFGPVSGKEKREEGVFFRLQ